jgi:ribonuclease J
MIEWTRPTSFVPVHGTLHHLRKHEALARSLGVSDVQVVEDGTAIYIPPEGPLERRPALEQGPVRITFGGQALEARQRRRRADLARRGIVMVSVRVDERGRPLKAPLVTTSGVAGVDDDDGAHSVLSASVREAVTLASAQQMSSTEEVVKRCLRKVIVEMRPASARPSATCSTVARPPTSVAWPPRPRPAPPVPS